MAGETGLDAAALEALNGPPGIPPASQQLNDILEGRDNRINVAKDIGEKVEAMILQAKQASETKVSAEIRKIKQRLEQLKEKIALVSERVNKLNIDQGGGGGLGVGLPKAELQRSITKLEEVWQNEVSTLKQELWQTIQAHNHNADLLKHHRDAIDAVHSKLPQVAPNPELVQIHRQLVQVDAIMEREQQKQQQLDALVQRFAVVQQHVNSAIGAWGDGGLSGYPGGASAALAAAAAGAGETAVGSSATGPKKKPKGTKTGKPEAASKAEPMKVAGGSQAATSLRPDAPEFVPIQANWPEDGA
mmetsp:Transcript_69688/g.130044  ORF Transcript_69688/g.130044 Transcript_69688/m.130044 type:complete len:303 (+) Transcript_69688:91-999(+)